MGSRRIAIIVGPVGESLAPTYLALAERAAAAAEARGGIVARAYSPNATPERVLEAVAGANIVIYFGHGTGYPNPYSHTLNPDKVNGWGLQGPRATGTHADSWADGSLAYYGEAWIAEHARPAAGFVMIYSNVCYAAGAGEPGQPSAKPDEARQRAGGYARTPLAMGASAVFATDFYAGAAELVGRLLSNPTTPYGDVVRSGSHYVAKAVSVEPHPYAGATELWLQRSPYFGGSTDYWFAFSGDSTASFASAGVGHADALLAAFRQPMTLTLQPGRHLALRIEETGAVVDRERWTTDQVSEIAVAERRRLPDREGAWYRIAEGEHSGAWIAEGAAAHLPGLALEASLQPPRVVELAAATHAGHRYSSEGMIDGSKVVTLPTASRATADALAVVDGQLHVRLTDGIWAGHWLLVTDAVRVAGPVPLPVAEAAAEVGPTELPGSPVPEPTETASPSETPTPSVAATPPPTPAETPSVSPEPTASSPSPSAEPSPAATGMPVSETPTATPTPSPDLDPVTPSPSSSPTSSQEAAESSPPASPP